MALTRMFDDAVQDFRYGSRMLVRSPGLTSAAVVCLAIGIGLTATTYAQVRSTMFRPVPGVERPSELVRLQRPAAFTDFEAFRDTSGQFSGLAAYLGPVPFVVGEPVTRAQRVWGHLATPNYFEVLGAKAALGRLFGAEERAQGAASVAVISHRLWGARFGEDPAIVGRGIRVNGQPVTVVGVTARGFVGASPATSAADIWIATTAPQSVAPELRQLGSRSAAFDVVGRLNAGLALTQAEQVLEPLARRLEQQRGDPGRHSNERRIRLLPGGRLFPLRNEDLPRAMGFPVVLLSLVLLMACGNVANMLLARGAARRREIAVRLAVGAGRGRIVRQLLTESLLLATLGGAVAIPLARALEAGMNSLSPLVPDYVSYDVRFDWNSFAVALLLTTVAGVAAGLAPALRSSREPLVAGLRLGAPSGLGARRWLSLRNILVFQQVAASMVLLLLTSFVVIGWRRSAGVDVGFQAASVFMVTLDPVRDGHSLERTREFFEKLPRRLESAGGVESVAVTQSLPLAMSGTEAMMGARTDFVQGTQALGALRAEAVGSGFFETVGARVLRGRGFTEDDQRDYARVVVVNETMASRAWPGRDPLGQLVTVDEAPWEVVGVVRDLRSAFPLAPAQPVVYRPISPSAFATPSRHGVTVFARVSPGLDAPSLLRREIEAVDPSVSVLRVRALAEELEQSLFLARVATVTYGGIGVFGLILSAVGLAGITAYAVARRTHEIGIRMALGARPADVLRLVLREGGVIAVAGTLAGLAVALAVLRALASFVDALAEATRTSASDPVLLLGAPALLASLALLACYLPARRSTAIDPLLALRSE